MTLQCDGVNNIQEFIMKIMQIVENERTGTCHVYRINSKTNTWTLLWDHSDGNFDKFVKWYGLPLHCKYEYYKVN